MAAIITEDQIEQGIVQRLQHLYGYDALDCNTADPADLNYGSGRRDKREVILQDRLNRAAVALNPGIPEAAIDDALKQICDRRQAMTMVAGNRELEALIHDGVRVALIKKGRHPKCREGMDAGQSDD
ncbi:MAG: type I restriction endonuclease [Wenzhouxiangella sp.]|jgi:type I restriction enzyme R subunit|nr:type I restriction endonuclease [Wenzhouxiangella sp.]